MNTKTFTILISFTFILTSIPSFAETPQQERRIEQEKRDSLASTVTSAPSQLQTRKEPIKDEDMIYFATLLSHKVVYRYDACKAVVLLLGVENTYIDLDSQIKFIKENNLIPKNYQSDFNPMEPLRRGVCAYMFCKTLNVRGGIFLSGLGIKNERYALKELVFNGIMSNGNIDDLISGDEFVSIVTESVNYIAKNKR